MSAPSTLEKFLESLRERGFAVTEDPDNSGYRIRERRGEDLQSARRLRLVRADFDEYFDTAVSTWELPPGATARGDEVVSLMAIYVEAALASVDTEGRNHLVEIGLRRNSAGRVDWYRTEDPSRTEQSIRRTRPDPDLRWVAEPERPTDPA